MNVNFTTTFGQYSLNNNQSNEISLLSDELNKWISDPSVTGDKQEAAKRIEEAFRNNATTLNLTWLKLNQLPRCIGRLTKLKELSLQYNYLTLLPPEIGFLTQLRKLNLHNNKLTSLPQEIGNLRELTELFSVLNFPLKITCLQKIFPQKLLYPFRFF